MPFRIISIKIDKSMMTDSSFALTHVPIDPFSHLVDFVRQDLC